jgi:hypothetical protein
MIEIDLIPSWIVDCIVGMLWDTTRAFLVKLYFATLSF